MAIDFPSSPSVNDSHTSSGKTWIWTGDYWKLYGTQIQGINLEISDTAPSPASQGDMWFESDTGRTFTYYDGAWVELGSTASITSFLTDADADTRVHVEESADEDVIRFDTAGTEKAFIDSTGLTVSGDLDVTGTIAGGSTTFPTTLDSGTMPAIEALQAKVGVDGSAVTTSIDYQLNTGYRYHSTVYFTSSGSFTKASYPWLRAIRVIVQAGGGGGGHADTTSAGQCSAGGGGGAGTWAQSFITDIASLASSVTVTVGAAGNGGLYATSTAATAGTDSSFGSGAAYEVSAGGGSGGVTITRSGSAQGIGGNGGAGGVGDLVIQGGGGDGALVVDPANVYSGISGKGAHSILGASGKATRANQGQGLSSGYGSGGTGSARAQSLTGFDGRDGMPGIVIVELYA